MKFMIRSTTSATVGIVTLLLLLTSVLPFPAAGQNCISLGSSGTGGAPIGAALMGLEIDVEDLLVTVAWGTVAGDDATLVLSTPAGKVLGVWPVTRVPGERTDHRLADVLAHVATPGVGFQLRLRLEDGTGTLAETRFRVVLICPEGEPCRFFLLPGFEGGPVAISDALWSALDDALEAGSTDLIATVRAEHPELAAEIPGLLWQLQTDVTAAKKGCRCRWLDVLGLDRDASRALGSRLGSRPTHLYLRNSDRATFEAGVQGIDGTIETEPGHLGGSALFGISLLCARTLGTRTVVYVTEWPSRPTLELEEPVLSGCPPPCTPRIEHSGDLFGCVQGTAAGGPRETARADGGVDATLALGRLSLIGAAAEVDVDADPGSVIRDVDRFEQSSQASLTATQALVAVESSAHLMVTAEQNQADHSYGFAAASLGFDLRLWVEPSCPGIPTHFAVYGISKAADVDGGVAMETWEDP